MKPSKTTFLFSILCILIVTLFAFFPALSNGWTTWDDNIYVTDNPVITDLSIDNIKIVFTNVLEGSYVPLTMISYMIDYQIGGYDPKVYHTTSLLLHLCNSCLVFFLAYQLSGNCIAALVVGLLFGIHPMRVESVAWISGRKDLLSMFFFLLSSISYLSFVRNERYSILIVSFFFFVCAIFSKIIVLTFPIMLFLFDHYKQRPISQKIFIEKIPFGIVAVIMAWIGYYGQESISAVKKIPNIFENIVVSFHGVLFYLEKFLFPFQLSNLYPYPHFLTIKFYLYFFFFFVLCFAVWKNRKNETIVFGTLFFFIALLPVLQFIRFSQIFAADRFTYFSYIGLFYIVGIYFSKAFDQWNKKIVLIVAFGIIAGLSIVTRERCGVWKDNSTLWQDMLSKYPNALE